MQSGRLDLIITPGADLQISCVSGRQHHNFLCSRQPEHLQLYPVNQLEKQDISETVHVALRSLTVIAIEDMFLLKLDLPDCRLRRCCGVLRKGNAWDRLVRLLLVLLQCYFQPEWSNNHDILCLHPSHVFVSPQHFSISPQGGGTGRS